MEDWIFWFDELGQEFNDLVGKKCANLGELSRLGLRVPYGFAISVNGCERFMKLTKAARELEGCVVKVRDRLNRIDACMSASCEARAIVESKPMPEPMEKEIRERYRELCRRTNRENLAVAVRSSGSVSMPGQMETYLNVTGEDSVVEHVKKVWGSAYTARAITFRLSKGLPLEYAPIGVAVMSLVNATAAGVVLTVQPTTGDTGKVVIEGSWGFGESVVSGEITPDSFVLDKDTLEVLDRKIAHKTGIVRTGPSGTVYDSIREDIRDKPCVEDEDLREIARTAIRVEQHFGVPQDMEWVLDGSCPPGQNIFWVQARQARYVKAEQTGEIDYLIDLMVRVFK